jgi:predicted signal transduction protein with EAL and GGDEF domain
VRQGDTLARLGGDEFIVLVETLRLAEDAARIAQKLLDELRAPLSLGGRDLFLTASLGISLCPDDAEDPEALLQHSDIAMYRAKAGGGDGFRLYRADMNLRSEERLSLESSLRKAIGLGQFALQFQPILDLASGGLAGCEALLRWRHPERGLLLPAAFIEIAEMTGVIFSLGPWVLRAACREARAWQHPGRPPLPVAANISPRQFQEPDLLGQIRTILAEEGLPASCLELEITETLAMQNPERTAEILHALKELGVAASIDDFGTGYSSLAYLKRFPIDTLKIDRSFVSGIDENPADATIAATVIAMARRLDLRVVAEGVERKEQRDWLRREGCDRAQGHLFSPPLWPAQLAARLAEAGGGPPS